MVSIRRAYGDPAGALRHPLPGPALIGAALVVSWLSWTTGRRWFDLTTATIVLGAAALAGRKDRWPLRPLAVLLVIAVVADARAGATWSGNTPRQLGPFHGQIAVVADPQPLGSAIRVVVEVEGERFEVWVRGRARRLRAATWEAGDRIVVSAERVAIAPSRVRRVAWQHVVGELRLAWVADRHAGDPLQLAVNRVRHVLERGSSELHHDQAALFRGLVIGDDGEQPRPMVERFRASGLSHLTAVSGQNLAFVIAAAMPLLGRGRPAIRWLATLGVIVGYVTLTRFEPSIMRAGAMAALSATGFVLGRQRAPARLLAVAVIALLLVDPLLVTSIGFWLSVGATAGVTVVGPRLASRLRRLGPFAEPVAVTLGAQAGIAVPALLVFERLPLVSVVTNPLAGPVAAFVMMYGLPAGLVAGAIPPIAPLVMLPCRIAVAWIDRVAAVGAAAEPPHHVATIGWAVIAAALAALAVRGRVAARAGAAAQSVPE